MTLHYITLHYTTWHYVTPPSTVLHSITLHYIHSTTTPTTLPSTTYHYRTLHYTPLQLQLHNYTPLELHYLPLHFRHYTTLHLLPSPIHQFGPASSRSASIGSGQSFRSEQPLPSQKPQLLPGDHLPISDRKLTTMSFTTRSSVVIDLFLSRFGFLQSEYVLIKTPFWFVKSLFLMVNAPVTWMHPTFLTINWRILSIYPSLHLSLCLTSIVSLQYLDLTSDNSAFYLLDSKMFPNVPKPSTMPTQAKGQSTLCVGHL